MGNTDTLHPNSCFCSFSIPTSKIFLNKFFLLVICSGNTITSIILHIAYSHVLCYVLFCMHVTQLMFLTVFLLQWCYILVIFSIAIAVPFTRATLYLTSVLYSSSKIDDLDLLNESYPRPSDAFLHFNSDMYERGNETIYWCVKFFMTVVFCVFGWCLIKFCTNEKKTCNCTCKTCGFVMCGIIAGFYLALGLSVTIMEIVDLDLYYKAVVSNHSHCNSSCVAALQHIRGILGAHHGVGFLLHIIEALILLSMMLSCVSIQNIWKEAEKGLDELECSNNNDYTNFVNKCKKLYRNTYKDIKGMLKLHRTWFVLQWISYFFLSTTDLVYALRLILPTGFVHMNQNAYRFWMAYIILFFIYEFASFIIPYCCGGLMNHAHAKFYDAMQEKNKSKFDGDDAFSKETTEIVIEKDVKCDFVPTIIFVNIDVPINSPGYLISVLFDVFTLVITIITGL